LVSGTIAAAVAAPSSGKASGAGTAAACTRVTNVEAIIDDSGSMAGSDSGRLRVQAMDLLINALDAKTNLGVIEFGSSFDPATPSADVVFPVEPVGANAASMKAALDTKIQADAGGTDYNAAFETARAAGPAAQARIFLTDGGHNVDTYNNTHLNPPPQAQTPTYVIGFSTGLSQTEDQARLQKIASDTGGRYFPLPDSSALQSVMNQIETTLTCQTPPKTFNDSLAQGKTKAHKVKLAGKSRSAQLALSWTSPLDRFTISGLKVVRKGKVVAKSSRKKARKLKVTVRKGSTFAVVKVSRLVKGSLRFKVKAATVGSGLPKVTLTTQVSQSRRR
jgi:von Willebrand factor type A domain